jgi:hypothetical protein
MEADSTKEELQECSAIMAAINLLDGLRDVSESLGKGDRCAATIAHLEDLLMRP